MTEPWKPWSDRVLDIFEEPDATHTVSCIGCEMPFGSMKGMLAHQAHCSLLADALRDQAKAERHTLRAIRHHEIRANTLNTARLSKREIEAERAREAEAERLIPVAHLSRPRTRGECESIERPCPFVSCRYHLYLDVGHDGNIKFNFPDREPDELVETCALDVADAEGETLEVCGELLNITRERIRQIEVKAYKRLSKRFGDTRAQSFEHPGDRGGNND